MISNFRYPTMPSVHSFSQNPFSVSSVPEPPLAADPAFGVMNAPTAYLSADSGSVLGGGGNVRGPGNGEAPISDLPGSRVDPSPNQGETDDYSRMQELFWECRDEMKESRADAKSKSKILEKFRLFCDLYTFVWTDPSLLGYRSFNHQILQLVLDYHAAYFDPLLIPVDGEPSESDFPEMKPFAGESSEINPYQPPRDAEVKYVAMIHEDDPGKIQVGDRTFWDPRKPLREALLTLIDRRPPDVPDGLSLYAECCRQLSERGWPENTGPVIQSAVSKLCDRGSLPRRVCRKDPLWQAIVAGQIFGPVSLPRIAASFFWGNKRPLAVLATYAAMSASMLIPGSPIEVRAVLGVASVVGAFMLRDPSKKWLELGHEYIVSLFVVLSYFSFPGWPYYSPSFYEVSMFSGFVFLFIGSALPYFDHGSRKARDLWAEWRRPERRGRARLKKAG